MTIETLKQNARYSPPVDAGTTSKNCASMGSRTKYSRLIGALFLLGFVSYGTGFGLVSSVVGVPGFVGAIADHQTMLILGALLMLLNSAVDVGKGVLFFPIVEGHGRRTALAYLAAMILEVALLAVGILSLLLIVPLGQHAGDAGNDWAGPLGTLLVQGNTTAYLIAMMTLSIGNILLWSLSFRVRLIPRWLSSWGVAGYVTLLVGATAEIFGVQVSLLASIPGGVFEVALGVWLLTKGFDPKAYGKASA